MKQENKSKITTNYINVRNPLQLGTAIRRFRKLQNLTQQEVSLNAALKQTAVSSVEAGTAGTRLTTIFKLLAALNLELIIRSRTAAATDNKPA